AWAGARETTETTRKRRPDWGRPAKSAKPLSASAGAELLVALAAEPADRLDGSAVGGGIAGFGGRLHLRGEADALLEEALERVPVLPDDGQRLGARHLVGALGEQHGEVREVGD